MVAKPRSQRERSFAIPYGVYDLGTNTGWLIVSMDHNAAECAVETIRRRGPGRGERNRDERATRAAEAQ